MCEKTGRSWLGNMVSEKQTITEPKGATCRGKRSTKGTMVSKIFGAAREGPEEGRQARGFSDQWVLARACEDSI